MLNRVVLVGRLVRDPEVRTSGQGNNIVGFSIAVDKRNKTEDQSANFFRCTAFGKTGDFVSSYLTKGRLVAVDGRLEQRKYTDKNGDSREAFEIIVDNVQGLDRPRDDGGDRGERGDRGDYRESTAATADEFDPFGDD